MNKPKYNLVLVTGGAGYVGSHLVRKLLDRGYRVRVLDSLLYKDAGIQGIRKHKDLEFIHGDMRHIDEVIRAVSDVDAVIDLAAIVGDPACELDPDTTMGTNYEATKLLIEICKLKKVRRFVFASSCSVYGSNPNLMLNEGSWLNPVSLYAETRLMSEDIILSQHGDVEPVILRLATVFGWSYRPRFDLVVNIMTAKATMTGKVQVFGGDQWRPNVHAQDVAEAFITALEAPAKKAAREIFNVGSDINNKTIMQIAEIVAKTVPGTEIEVMADSPDKRDYKVDFSKIEYLLGYRAKFSIEEGVREIHQALKRGEVKNYQDDIYYNVKYLFK